MFARVGVFVCVRGCFCVCRCEREYVCDCEGGMVRLVESAIVSVNVIAWVIAIVCVCACVSPCRNSESVCARNVIAV